VIGGGGTIELHSPNIKGDRKNMTIDTRPMTTGGMGHGMIPQTTVSGSNFS
jgi:hypothetical protein